MLKLDESFEILNDLSFFLTVQIWILIAKFCLLLGNIFPLGSGSVDLYIFADPSDPKHCSLLPYLYSYFLFFIFHILRIFTFFKI